MKNTQLFVALAILASTVLFVGCGGAKVKTQMVTGVVKLDGTPIEGAAVTFVPATGTLGAYGITNASGVYTLTTQGGAEGKGAVEGEYKVGITKQENVAPTPTQDEINKASEEGRDITKEYPTEWKDVVPSKYSAPDLSGLTATVKKGKNTVDFELTTE